MVTPRKPKPVPLSKWIEAVVRLLSGIAAVPGPIELHPYQVAIADTLAEPKIERVSKSARVSSVDCFWPNFRRRADNHFGR